MAVVKPFRAVRYDAAVAGPLGDLVAPPYDVLSPAERAAYARRSAHNVVHLTLPESDDDAVRLWRDWQERGVLARDDAASCWALQQEYVGPDGVARTRTGLVASLRVEPYETRAVLPHERTHRGPKEGRLSLLRATRVQLEPIFLLYDGEQPFEVPARAADVDVEGTRLWRLDGDPSGAFADPQLLIADGHHRYETAVAFHEEEGTPESAFMPVVLVSTSDPGLTIFPTHRVFSARADPSLVARSHELGAVVGNGRVEPESALRALAELPYDRPAFVAYDGGRARVLQGGGPQLDVELVDRLGHEGISYTPDWREAVRRVDEGDAALACLLRATRIEDVFAAARRGHVLPQKTTYFYPKLLSGLLFHPV